jgi:hypothetical protein
MKAVFKNIFAGFCVSALCSLVLFMPARAQVLAHSSDASGAIGYDHTSYTSSTDGPIPTSKYFLSGSGGYNVTPYITVLGEYKFDPLDAPSGNLFKWHSQLYGGAARFNFTPSKKIVPYVTVGVGGYRLTASKPGTIQNVDGYYVNFGGGASVYLGKHWGIRPEVRYERQHCMYNPAHETLTANVADVSGSFFYQFGGTGNKKK